MLGIIYSREWSQKSFGCNCTRFAASALRLTPSILFHPSTLLQQILPLKYLINHIPGHIYPQFHAIKTLRRAISCLCIISATVALQETQRRHTCKQYRCSQPALCYQYGASNYSEGIRQPLPLGVGISGKQLLTWEAVQKHALSTISFLKSSIDILQESCHNYQYESGIEDTKKLPSEVLHPGTCCRHLVQAHELHSSHHSSNITHFSCEGSRRNSLPAEWGNRELSPLQFASQAAKWLATSFVF